MIKGEPQSLDTKARGNAGSSDTFVNLPPAKSASGPTTVWILGDQLSLQNSALLRAPREETTVLMVESKARGSFLKYHQVKLVLVYSAMRHFADSLRLEGWRVEYHELDEGLTFETAAKLHIQRCHPARILVAQPNSFFETDALQKLGRKLRIAVEFVPTGQFLLPREEFQAWAAGSKRLIMENHYRRMRKRHQWLAGM